MHIVADQNLDSVKIEKDFLAEAVGTGTFDPDAERGSVSSWTTSTSES